MIRLPSIRSKLLVLFFLFGAVPILVVSLLSYFNSMKAVEEMVGKRTVGVSSSVAESRDGLLAQATDSEIIWVNKPVQSYLSALVRGDRALAMEARDEVELYYPKIFERYQALDEIILSDREGRPILRQKPSANIKSGWELIGAQIGKAVTGLEFFGDDQEQDEESGGFRFQMDLPSGNDVPLVPLELLGGFDEVEKEAARFGLTLEPGDYRCLWTFTSDGDPEVRVVHPVFSNREPSKRLGSAILKLDSSELFHSDLALEPFGQQGEIALVDEATGIALYHSVPALVGRALKTADPDLWDAAMALDGTEQVAKWHKAPGEYGTRLVASNRMTNAPWRTVVTALPKEFASETQQAGIINLLIAAFATLVAAFLVVYSSGRISQSIQTVTAGAREISQGNLYHSIDVQTHDEIQILGETFNQMTESLRENITLREKASFELEELNQNLELRVSERTQELENLNGVLNQANKELKELDQLKTTFLANVSHEFKTPLTSIKAFAEILKDEVDEVKGPAEMSRFLGIINSETDRLGRLIKNLLSLSQIESGRIVWKKSLFPVRAALDAALDGLLPVLQEKKIKLKTTLPSPDLYAYGDQDRIQEVVTNLVENGVKFSDQSHEMEIYCHEEQRQGGPFLHLEIKDYGCGIPKGEMAKVFERFSQVDPSDTRQKGGTGLGLAICKEIVEYHGGEIWVESRVDHGSIFHFTLPLADSKEERDSKRA